jgi:hypothetical protein
MTLSLNPILEVEASIVDKAGNTVPLSGQVFYILERSPIDILRGNDLKGEIAFARAMNALRNLATTFFITDTQGKAEIKQSKSGTYHICGIRHTQQQAGVWNIQIELLPGKNKLVLNDANMMDGDKA